MIEASLADGVRVLRMNRPDKKNALDGAMYTALAEALEDGNTRADIRCQMICGLPGAFCAGNDIADFLKIAGKVPIGDTPVLRFLRALVRNEKPLVAAVDGFAIGVGTTMLFHCDRVFAAPGALFRTPFVDLGLVPEAGSSLIAPQLMGHKRAFELLCLGSAFSADKALQAGLISEIVDGDVEAAALASARDIAARPPEAMAISRRLLRGDVEAIAARIEEEAMLFAERLKSPEAQGAFEAFLSKS